MIKLLMNEVWTYYLNILFVVVVARTPPTRGKVIYNPFSSQNSIFMRPACKPDKPVSSCMDNKKYIAFNRWVNQTAGRQL